MKSPSLVTRFVDLLLLLLLLRPALAAATPASSTKASSAYWPHLLRGALQHPLGSTVKLRTSNSDALHHPQATPHHRSESTKKPRAETVYSALKDSRVIPDVLPASSLTSHNLTHELTLKWAVPSARGPTRNDGPTGGEDRTVSPELGNSLRPSDLGARPGWGLRALGNASSPGGGSSANAVVVLTDADARSRGNPDWAEMCHWIAYVQVGCAHGVDVVDYFPPGPPPSTGSHRYVALAFFAANGTDEPLDLEKPKGRKHWGYGPGDDTGEERVRGAVKWAKGQGLEIVGANFFTAENEGD